MTSLRNLIAVAAAVLPLAGQAQTPPAAPAPLAQIYGTLNLNLQYTEAPGATTPGQSVKGKFAVSPDSSNIGVKGAADVAQGLQVVYQCELSAPIDGSAGAVCTRNSRLGVSSPVYGTLFYGNWDTPYKAAWYGTKADDAFGNTDVYDAGGIIGSPGFNVRSNAGQTAAAPAGTAADGALANAEGTFNVRAANSVAYHSPRMMGLMVRAQWSVAENADAKNIRRPELFSVGANYDMGPISVLAAYEQHEDWLSQRSTDTGLKFGAGYELGTPFGATTIGAVYEMLKYDDKAVVAAATAKKYDRDAWMVNLKHRTGNHEFRARFQMADAGTLKTGNGTKVTGDAAKLGATNFALGYAYYLSKAAQAYLYYTQVTNEKAASYALGSAGGPPVAGAVPVGADPWSLGLGLRYAF